MTDLFIPPQGAMQFEVTNDYEGKPRSAMVWVERVKRTDYSNACSCDPVYRMVHLGIATPKQCAVIKQQQINHPRTQIILCPCIGHLIE